MARRQPVAHVEQHNVYQDVNADAAKAGVAVEEVVAARITEDHLVTKSREALNLRSRAGFRLCLIMLVMAVNQAGYSIDWGIISSINFNTHWHDYFGFENKGSTLGVINALMTISSFCDASFLCLADKIGRRSVNFTGCFLTIAAAAIQAASPNITCLMARRFILGVTAQETSRPRDKKGPTVSYQSQTDQGGSRPAGHDPL